MPLLDQISAGDDVKAGLAEVAAKLEGLEGQAHLYASWPPAGVDDDHKIRLLEQVASLDKGYPGGLAAYIASARTLLAQSQRGENPLAGWKPSVPADGYDIQPGSDDFALYERAGLEAATAGQLGFVVPAGGLGERLGFHGVKFALPVESCTSECVLGVYCAYIRSLERLAPSRSANEPPVTLPLAIMVSADTEAGIGRLLEEHDYFGLRREQVTLLKQEKVAALSNADAAFSMGEPYTVATKPHGHGDVHFLLHSSGTARRWYEQGVRWMHFFQDTNTNYFSTFLATLGVSIKRSLAVNLVATPRKAKEAVGAVCKLTHEDGRTMVCNVEYNQLEPLLIASGHPDGDVNEADGLSRFPGNINQIIINLESWLSTVATSQGAIDEFINPKYADASRTAFKSATRLECMMQDYVKTVGSGQVVGWTRYPIEYGYFPCKNDIVSAAKLSASGVPPHSASSAEMAVYHMYTTMLVTLGATLGPPTQRTFRQVEVSVGPSIVLHPSFAPCFTCLADKMPSPSAISISSSSSLVVRGEEIVIEHLHLEGSLVIDVADGGSLRIVSLTVKNEGWAFEELDDAAMAAAEEVVAIRGFTVAKRATRTIKVAAGEHFIIDGKARKAELAPLQMKASKKELKRVPTHGFSELRKQDPSLAKDALDPASLAITVRNERAGCGVGGCVLA